MGLQPGVPLTIPLTVMAEDDVTSQRYFIAGEHGHNFLPRAELPLLFVVLSCVALSLILCPPTGTALPSHAVLIDMMQLAHSCTQFVLANMLL